MKFHYRTLFKATSTEPLSRIVVRRIKNFWMPLYLVHHPGPISSSRSCFDLLFKGFDNSKSTRYARSLRNPIYENKTSNISSKKEEPEAVVSNFVANWVYTPRSRPDSANENRTPKWTNMRIFNRYLGLSLMASYSAQSC
jgi:hypothetical protein